MSGWGSLVVAVLKLALAVIKLMAERQADARRDGDKKAGRAQAYLEATRDAQKLIDKAREARRNAVAAHRTERVQLDTETGAGT